MSRTPQLGDLLADLGDRVEALISARRTSGTATEDPFRGLYISADMLDTVLQRSGPPPGAGADRLGGLAASFGLDEIDLQLLVIALAPDVDPAFETCYGFLNDDVTRRRASVGLALTLCGLPTTDARARSRFTAGSALVDGGLLVVSDPDQPALRRALHVPDRVADHVLGGDRLDGSLVHLVRSPDALLPAVPGLVAALSSGPAGCYLREQSAGDARARAASALQQAGLPVLELDLRRLLPGDDLPAVAAAADREARLRGAVLLAGPLDPESDQAVVLSALRAPRVLFGTTYWNPAWSALVPLTLEVAPLTSTERRELWRSGLGIAEAPDPLWEAGSARWGAEQIDRVAHLVQQLARARNVPVGPQLIPEGLRATGTAGLLRLARRVQPAVGWDDLVLPPPTRDALQELAARARNRDLVLGEWRLRRGGGRGRGVAALFTGVSGTGKTTAAEVIAGELGVDLYTVDLATVIDKYIGETEKNLDRIFTEAAGADAVLLFDEADAIFGKRSAVSDARDRYANIESAYLLQRMEYFDGLVILATNLRSNLDEAFTRRLDTVIDFPRPDAAMRQRLWDVCLGPAVPRSADLDLTTCASIYELAGGDIQSASITVAYRAAATGAPVRTADIADAVEHEYRKLGRLRPPVSDCDAPLRR